MSKVSGAGSPSGGAAAVRWRPGRAQTRAKNSSQASRVLAARSSRRWRSTGAASSTARRIAAGSSMAGATGSPSCRATPATLSLRANTATRAPIHAPASDAW